MLILAIKKVAEASLVSELLNYICLDFCLSVINGLTCMYSQLYVVEAQQLIAVIAPY
jgi:hypothetical protein